MSEPTPKCVAVIEALAANIARIQGLRSAVYDVPIDDAAPAARTLPAAYVYDYNDDTVFSDCQGRYTVTLNCEIVFLYEYSSESQGRREGNRLIAEAKKAIANDLTLGGMAWMLRPTGKSIQMLIAEGRRLSSATLGVEVKFDEQITNPYELAA